MMGKNRVLPLTHEILEQAGVELPGHRAKILVHLELMAGVFEENMELCNFLETSDKRSTLPSSQLKSTKSAQNIAFNNNGKFQMQNFTSTSLTSPQSHEATL